jgi:hypothetical protein
MSARVLLLALVGLALTACGPAQRRIIVTSEPTGARVHLNDIDVGVTPVEVDFTFFGVYAVRLRKDGYEPLVTSREAEAPVHEWPGIDLIALAIPGQEVTELRWHFELEPADADAEAVVERARALRERMGEDE